MTPAVAAAALSFYLAKLKFPAWSFGNAIGCHQWAIPLRAATDALPGRFGGAGVAAVMARNAGRSEARCRSATCLIPNLPG